MHTILTVTKLYIVMVAIGLLAGCASTRTTELNIEDKEIVHISIPTHLTQECKPEKPIDKESYLALKIYEREEELSRYIVTLYSTIAQCNSQISQIKKLNIKRE